MTAGFGLEKLGMVALRFPRATLAILVAITCLFAWQATKLQFSSDIREIFRSASPDFINLEAVNKEFPESHRDILIVIEGENIFDTQRLEQLRALHLDLSLVENVGSVLSIFSARTPPESDGKTSPLFPVEFTGNEDLKALEKNLQAHPLVGGRLLSKDGRLTLFIMSFTKEAGDVETLKAATEEIQSLASELLEGTGLKATLTGSSVMRVEIIGALIRDQQTFRLAGLTAALLLCWIFFRSFSYVVIATAPAAVAIFGLKGGMVLAGQHINVLTNVIPTLVLVIAFASAMHLLFAIRRNIANGLAVERAIETAVDEIGPACVLTTATTTLALLSLTLVPHGFVQSFGWTAALGTAFAYIGIMTTVPPLARILLRNATPESAARGESDIIQEKIRSVSLSCARMVRDNAFAVATVGVILTGAAGVLYALNVPTYQYQDNLPHGNPALNAIETINEKLSGTNSLLLHVRLPETFEPKSEQTLDLVKAAHDVLDGNPKINSVSSLHSVEKWFVEGGLDRNVLFAFLDDNSAQLAKRVLSTEHRAALLTGNFTSLPAADLLALIDELNAQLKTVSTKYPGSELTVTGLVPVSARASTEMIGELNQSLMIAVAVIILLIGLALRSPMAGLQSILPNILPITIAGACLYIFGKGLQFNSVVAFTIGFGIAVDNTIHVLNRYRLERQSGQSVGSAIETTIANIGPVLIVSTAVLIAGVGGTMLSELPLVRLYGQVITLLLGTALIGALILLPAIIRLIDDWRQPAGRFIAETEESKHPGPAE